MRRITEEYEKSERNEVIQEFARDDAVQKGGMRTETR